MEKKSRISIYSFFLAGILFCTMSSCKKETIPSVITFTATNITETSAVCGGEIASDGNGEITARGVCWSTSPNPTINDDTTCNGTGDGSFSSILKNLSPHTIYYICAYATNSKGTDYGGEDYFTTLGSGGTVTDIDGNVYNTVNIGTQVWMVENLRTTKYQDGSSIPNITDSVAWSTTTGGAYCNYNNNTNNASVYGLLYNWYAVTDNRNIAPEGWHVSTSDDWLTLENYIIQTLSDNTACLVETGTTHWDSPNTGATNSTGFTALPGGNRSVSNGNFIYVGMGFYGYWWSPSSSSSSTWGRHINDSDPSIYPFDGILENSGCSVRCVKD